MGEQSALTDVMNRNMHHGLVPTDAGGLLARILPGRLTRGTAPLPGRLTATPPAFIRGNAQKAAQLYSGVFTFGRSSVDCGGASIFAQTPPDASWAQRLHGFEVLADLAAADTALARAFARSLIEDWAQASLPRIAHRPAVTARRLINWLTYAPVLLIDAEPAFAVQFIRLLQSQTLRLKRRQPFLFPGIARLSADIALIQSALCLDDPRLVASASKRLVEDLPRVILPDGGVVTRNPHDLVVLTLDLLTLRETFGRRDVPPPAALMTSLDRMLPMLRAFRHADGTLALFNGMGATDRERLEIALGLDDAKGRPVLNAAHSFYQRLEGQNAVLIMDTGRPARQGHAGSLSFEFGTQAARLIVNCGTPDGSDLDEQRTARSAAAHSTAVLGTPARRFAWPGHSQARMIEIGRENGPSATLLRASHDLHARRFGLIHERTVRLAADGSLLEGVDTLKPVAGRSQTSADMRLAFHLHPDLRAQPLEDGRSIALLLPDDDLWVFAAEDHTIALEESVFHGDASGPRRSAQIVIRPGMQADARVTWSLRRTAPAPS